MVNLKNFNEYINEKAIPFDDILDVGTQQGLLVKDVSANVTIDRLLSLYDFDDSQILAFLQMRKWNKRDDVWKISMTVAEKNYGPDIYDLALMSAYPESVVPSSAIKPDAQKIWTYYYNHRPDVKKVKINPDDDLYVSKYETYVDGAFKYDNDPSVLEIINTKYSLESSEVYDKLIKRGDEYKDKYNVLDSKIFKISKKYFWSRYD